MTKTFVVERAPVVGYSSYSKVSIDQGVLTGERDAPPPVATSLVHKTKDEVRYCIEGYGEAWREHGNEEVVVEMRRGTSPTIQSRTHFQFCAPPFMPADRDHAAAAGTGRSPAGHRTVAEFIQERFEPINSVHNAEAKA